MLVLPTTGISRSTTTHNVKLDILCDWIEGNLLFDEEELFFEDIVSHLLVEQIYDNSDMASEIIASAWTELRRRQSWISSGAPFTITSRRISRNLTWKRVPAHSFCLLLSLASSLSQIKYRDSGLFADISKNDIFGKETGHEKVYS